MEAVVDCLAERLSLGHQFPGREWIYRELVLLLPQYPGGLTTAVIQTHLRTLWLSQVKQASLGTAACGSGGTKSVSPPGGLPQAVPMSHLKQKTAIGPETWVGELDVVKVARKTAGVLSEANPGAVRRVTRATLELSDGLERAFLDVHSRFLPYLEGPTAPIAGGSRLRLTGTNTFGKALPGLPDRSLRLLPSESMVVVGEEPEANEGMSLADVAQLKTEEGDRRVLQQAVVARVASIGPEESGCWCGLCFFGSRQGRHRWIVLEDLRLQGSPQSGPVSIPFLLYDQQTSMGVLLQEGETVLIDSVTACQLSSAAAAALDDSLAAAGCPTGLSRRLCLAIGPETLIRASSGSLPNKKHKSNHGGQTTASPPWDTTLTGQLRSVRVSKQNSRSGGGLSMAPPPALSLVSTQKPQAPAATSVVLSLQKADGAQVEVEVTCSFGTAALGQLLRSLMPGQTVTAFPVIPKGSLPTGATCRSYSCALEGQRASIQNLSVLPGLLSSPQIHRSFLHTLGNALGKDEGSHGGGPVLAEAILEEVNVRVRRVHNFCHRPVSSSTLLEGFFDDDEDMRGDSEAADDPDLPMSPSGVTSSIFDGLWECQFCSQDCGCRQLELQMAGVCRVRGCCDGRCPAEVTCRPLWMPVDGLALEAMLQMNAVQFTEMTPEQRLHLQKSLAGRRVVLSLAAALGGHSWASSMVPPGEPVADAGVHVCGAWWPPEAA